MYQNTNIRKKRSVRKRTVSIPKRRKRRDDDTDTSLSSSDSFDPFLSDSSEIKATKRKPMSDSDESFDIDEEMKYVRQQRMNRREKRESKRKSTAVMDSSVVHSQLIPTDFSIEKSTAPSSFSAPMYPPTSLPSSKNRPQDRSCPSPKNSSLLNYYEL